MRAQVSEMCTEAFVKTAIESVHPALISMCAYLRPRREDVLSQDLIFTDPAAQFIARQLEEVRFNHDAVDTLIANIQMFSNVLRDELGSPKAADQLKEVVEAYPESIQRLIQYATEKATDDRNVRAQAFRQFAQTDVRPKDEHQFTAPVMTAKDMLRGMIR